MLKTYKIKRSPLASLVGVYEELGELASALLQEEGFKERKTGTNINYIIAEVFAELLKLATDLEVDLDKEFRIAIDEWKESKPLWK
jgi:NTP pyrophosphatase (non-canonical NTP hydrolase)